MDEHPLNVLVVDDDRDFVNDFKLLLPSNMQFGVTYSAKDAMIFLATHDIDVVFLDIDLGSGSDGMDLLSKIKEEWPYLVVVMITADQRVNSVVKAMQLGASDYVGKDPDLGKLKLSIDRAISQARLQQRYDLLAKELRDRVGDLIGESDAIRNVREEMARLSQVSSNVLITGESGTGKELVARGIHRLSPHRNQPFLAVNCAALSKELIESELFGHEKGSFTGAHSRRIGKFELVGEGTLFLDEITEIPPELQAKLLRVLQEREFERVGGNSLIPFQGRLLTSSNRGITQVVEDGSLREDLYYRVNVSHLHLPTLAERKEDIPILVNYFVDVKSRDMKKPVRGVSQKALQLLSSYHWPGNVRELINLVEDAVAHCDEGLLQPSHFGRLLVSGLEMFDSYDEAKKYFLLKFQHDYISAGLARNKGNVSRTAEEMGLSRGGLIKMIQACGLTVKHQSP